LLTREALYPVSRTQEAELFSLFVLLSKQVAEQKGKNNKSEAEKETRIHLSPSVSPKMQVIS